MSTVLCNAHIIMRGMYVSIHNDETTKVTTFQEFRREVGAFPLLATPKLKDRRCSGNGVLAGQTNIWLGGRPHQKAWEEFSSRTQLLMSRINVLVRLLIFESFSHQYAPYSGQYAY